MPMSLLVLAAVCNGDSGLRRKLPQPNRQAFSAVLETWAVGAKGNTLGSTNGFEWAALV